jgi:hypothetical protein
MLGERTHKIAVAIAFVPLTAWLLIGSWQLSQSSHPSIEYRDAAAEQDGTNRQPKQEREKTDEAIARYTWWLMIFTGILAFATIGLGVATVRLYLAGEKQIAVSRIAAEAAKKSADTSLASLRPWVSCDAKIISDLTYRANGDPCVTIQFTSTNHGQLPAMGVRLQYWFHLLSPVHIHSISAQQKIADLLRGLPAIEHGVLLFRGETHTVDVELPISRSEIEKSIEDMKPQKHFFPELLALVSYTYPLASHNPQTGRIWHLRRKIPHKTYGFAFGLDEPSVLAENMVLREHTLWGGYAT